MYINLTFIVLSFNKIPNLCYRFLNELHLTLNYFRFRARPGWANGRARRDVGRWATRVLYAAAAQQHGAQERVRYGPAVPAAVQPDICIQHTVG